MKRDLAQAKWLDHPANPLIEPPRPEWMIADPTVLSPDQTPDGRWHLYANSVGFIHHFVSGDGIEWTKVGKRLFRGFRPFLYVEDETCYLMYELHARPWYSRIVVRTSSDISRWSDFRVLLAPSLPWDGKVIRFLGNPCLVKAGDEYRLYYSSSWIWLWDCMYFEPRNVGVATASSLLGPYTKSPEPLIAPTPGHRYLNFGAGSVKVITDGEGGWWMFNNGIYKDEEKRSRSAIILWHSRDGFAFEQKTPAAIIGPEPAGWKRAFVYAFCLVDYANEFRLYYNARDGWLRGSERIGMARAELS